MPRKLSTPEDEFYKTIDFLQKRVFPKLNDDDLLVYSLKMKKWFEENLGSLTDDEIMPPPGDESRSN